MQGMTSMKMTPKMKREMSPEVASSGSNAPEYPYGTKLTVEDDHVHKLGMDDAMVGEEVMVTGKGKVVACRKNDMEGGKGKKSVEVQMTEMKMDRGMKMDKGAGADKEKSSPRSLGVGPKASKRMEMGGM